LVHRQRVEELVGQEDDRAFRNLIERIVPQDRFLDVLERLLLALAQRRAHLDQVHHQRGQKLRHDLRRAQRVKHHGAAARAKLDQPHVLRLAHLLPHRSRPQPDQLAEDLAHLRRGDEIAGATERIAGHVVAVLGMGEAQRHELPHRHRPGKRDAPADFGFERRRR
jgi:hypothetical protein